MGDISQLADENGHVLLPGEFPSLGHAGGRISLILHSYRAYITYYSYILKYPSDFYDKY